MATVNETRKLAPDTKWILTTVAGGAVIMIAVFQYQLDSLAKHFEQRIERTAELTLERAKSQNLSRKEMDKALRPRDDLLKTLASDISDLRVGRAKQSEVAVNLGNTMERIIQVAIETQGRAASTEGQLKQLLKQAEANAVLVDRIITQNQNAFSGLSERLTRLEGAIAPVSRSGTP